MVCSYCDNYSKATKIYTGPDAVYELIKNKLEEEHDLYKIINKESNKKNDI